MLDYYVVTSLSVESSEAESFRFEVQKLLLPVGGNIQGP